MSWNKTCKAMIAVGLALVMTGTIVAPTALAVGETIEQETSAQETAPTVQTEQMGEATQDTPAPEETSDVAEAAAQQESVEISLGHQQAAQTAGGGSVSIDADGWVTADWLTGGRIQFDVATGTVIDADESVVSVDIPSEINGVEVTAISGRAFIGCEALTTISIPETVESLGDGMWASSDSLENISVAEANPSFSSIDGVLFDKAQKTLIKFPAMRAGAYTIPNGVTRIEKDAFWGACLLTLVIIPDTVTVIGTSAFGWCDALTSVEMGDAIATIGDGAFVACKQLKTIEIPASVTCIEPAMVIYCQALTHIDVHENNQNYCSVDGVLFDSQQKTLVAFPAGCTGEYRIPEGTTAIERSAFGGACLSAVVIPASVDTIGQGAFNCCVAIEEIVIPDGVTTIEHDLFANSEALASVKIPDSVTVIDGYAFANCYALGSIQIPDGVTALGEHAFYSCSSLEKIQIPDSVTAIGEWAFEDCSSNLTICASEGSYAQNYANRNGIAFEAIKDNTVIDADGWVTADWLTGGRIQFDVATGTIKGADKTITSAMIPEAINGIAVTSIGFFAFNSCTALTSVRIPDSITSMVYGAFSGCSALEQINIPRGVTQIADSLFSDCTRLASITIPDGVTSIGIRALYNCTALTSIHIPDSVTSIGDGAFRACTGLTTMIIPDGFTRIERNLFYDCENLTSVTIPDSVTCIGDSAFSGCESLASVKLPDSVTSMGNWVFSECIRMKRMTIPDGVTQIGASLMNRCTDLTSVKIPASVTSIGEDAFNKCFRLSDVYYQGTEQDWQTISLGDGNDEVTGATIHYNVDFSVITLSETTVKMDHHAIYVQDEDFNPIFEATVTIDGVDYLTNIKGMVEYKGTMGTQSVRVSAAGYQETVKTYELAKGTAKVIYLGADSMEGKPYVTTVAYDDTGADARITPRYLTHKQGETVRFQIQANWNDHGAGEYLLYNEAGKSIASQTGELSAVIDCIFAPNQAIWLKIVAADGTASAPIRLPIYVTAAPEQAPYGGSISLPSASGSVQDSIVTQFFPGEYTLEYTDVPYTIATEVDPSTGNVIKKVKIGIVDCDDSLADAQNWFDYKVAIAQSVEAEARVCDLSTLLSQFEVRSGVLTLVKGWENAEFEAVGYAELVYDQTGALLSQSGGMVVSVDAQQVQSKLFLDGRVPTPLKFACSVTDSMGGAITFEPTTNSFVYGGELRANPQITIETGLSVSGLATVSGSGAATLNMGLAPNFAGEALFASRLRTSLFGVVGWNDTLAQKIVPLWGTGDAAPNASSDASSTSASAGDGASLTMLQRDVAPTTMPEVFDVNGQKILLFTMGDAGATTGNHMRLMYARYDSASGNWSQPKTVSNQATSDLYYKAYVQNDTLYIIQQKLSESVPETADASAMLAQMAAKTDLVLSVWDAGNDCFTTQAITEDSVLDLYPTLAFKGDTMTAVWATNRANNVMGTQGSYAIYARDCVGGTWSAPRKLYETSLYLSALASGYVSGELEVLFSLATGDGIGNIYQLVGDRAQMVAGQGTNGTALQFQNGAFYWSSDGAVQVYQPATQQLSKVMAGGNQPIASSYHLTQYDGSDALVWFAADYSGASTIYASLLENGNWSNPIALYTTADFSIQSMDVLGSTENRWDFILNTVVTNAQGAVQASMQALTVQGKIDLTKPSVSQDNGTQSNSHEVDVSLTLTQERIDDKVVLVATAQNPCIASVTCALEIRVGSLDSEPIETLTIYGLNYDETYYYRRAIDLNEVEFDGANSVRYYVTVVPDSRYRDITSLDNVAYAALYPSIKPAADPETLPLTEAEHVSVSGLRISTSQVDIAYIAGGDNTATITTTALPFHATNQAVIWKSDATDVATVKDGIVTAHKAGSAFLTATTKDGGFEASAMVIVTEQEVVLPEIIFDFCDDGSVTNAMANTSANGQLETLPSPVRAGYAFDGWYTDPADGTRIAADTVFAQDTTLYAHWLQSYGTRGDVDGDERISIKDAIQLAQAAENDAEDLMEAEKARADIDMDGGITKDDFAQIVVQVLRWMDLSVTM